LHLIDNLLGCYKEFYVYDRKIIMGLDHAQYKAIIMDNWNVHHEFTREGNVKMKMNYNSNELSMPPHIILSE
jgi:hypothetical protein